MAAPEQLGDVGKRLVDTMIGSTNLPQARPPRRGGRGDRLPRLRRRLVRDGPVARGERRPCQNLNVPEHVRIREVGPRDGFQNEPEVIPTDDKVRLVELLARTGVSGSRSRASCAPT
jgi:hypothetical protein